MVDRAPHLFLDCDGVLADFDAGAEALLGMPVAAFEARFGRGAFWKRLAGAPDFYGSLPEMADARTLFEAVADLKPTILTGLPMGRWAAPQKERWAAEHFPGTPIITCMARDKYLHLTPGDVLVDDRTSQCAAWEDSGGVFVHHLDAKTSLERLASLFPSIVAPD